MVVAELQSSVVGRKVVVVELRSTCTVHRSSEESSTVVPMKSKVRQACESLSSAARSACLASPAISRGSARAAPNSDQDRWNISNSCVSLYVYTLDRLKIKTNKKIRKKFSTPKKHLLII